MSHQKSRGDSLLNDTTSPDHYRKSNQKMKKFADLFSLLASDPEQNIRLIVQQACKILGMSSSMYSRLDNKQAVLVCWAGYDPAPDFPESNDPGGRICFEATIKSDRQPVAFEDLSQTAFQQSDPFVRRFGLACYLGFPVYCDGKPIGSLCVTDIRPRRFDPTDFYMMSTLAHAVSLEEERNRDERRYRVLYTDAPVMLYSVDDQDRLLSVSTMWLETMGYRRDEVLGRKALDFMTPQSRRHCLESCLPEFYKSGRMKNRPFQLVTRQGRILNVLINARAWRHGNGEYAGAQVYVADVTDSSPAHPVNPNLSNTNDQQARKMETIATLAGGVAHQFNNALAVILGNLELIELDGLRSDKLNRYMTPIGQAGRKMVQLTSQLLAYARGGKFQTIRMKADIFVKETLQLVGHSLAPCVEIQTNLAESSGLIDVDTTQMQMLLSAILSNASEAIQDAGTVRVKLADSVVDAEDHQRYPGLKPGRYVLLQVTDSGKGMDPPTLARIFEPFFTTKFEGRGLGMAAVYGIVKKHKGYIYVNSQTGKGTEVQVYLPCLGSAYALKPADQTGSAARAGTALIVEDEHLVMEIHRMIVERLGYQVLEALTGKEAVRLAKEHKGTIDFVLLDIILPDMNGTQIYPQLMQARPGLKVIVCSGFTLDGPATQILEAGAQHFIQKPFTITTLSGVLKEMLHSEN